MSVHALTIDTAETNFFSGTENLKQMDFHTPLDSMKAPYGIHCRIYLDIPGALSGVSIPSIANDVAKVIRQHFDQLYEPMYVVHEDKSCTAEHAMPTSREDEILFRDDMAKALNKHGVEFKMFVNRGFIH